MTIVVATPDHYYSLLSSDTKPAVPAHDLAYETDTGNWFHYTGATWVAYSGPTAAGAPAVEAEAPSNYINFGTVSAAFIKASAGNVFSIACYNENAAVRYFQLHNKATIPLATEVPVFSFPVPAGTANNPGSIVFGDDFFTRWGHYFATGIGWAISTTEATFTDAATAAEHGARVRYV